VKNGGFSLFSTLLNFLVGQTTRFSSCGARDLCVALDRTCLGGLGAEIACFSTSSCRLQNSRRAHVNSRGLLPKPSRLPSVFARPSSSQQRLSLCRCLRAGSKIQSEDSERSEHYFLRSKIHSEHSSLAFGNSLGGLRAQL
jgi:hypothetical protein